MRYERNILKHYQSATPEQIKAGVEWYPNASKVIADIGVSPAVVAVLSPRVTWDMNIKGAKRIAESVRYAGSIPVVAGTRANVNKAWHIATTGDESVLSGPKVSAFHENLKGNLERVTVDVWAARAAGVPDRHMAHLDGKRYQTIEKAYQAAAIKVGLRAAELQAIVWIVVRGKGD